MIQLQTVSGPDFAPYLDAVAQLRITVFREFPYLYDGDHAYERDYLQIYLSCPRSRITMAMEGDAVVGASTALPLTDAEDDFQQPFVDHGYDRARFLYLGESVLLPDYRGKGIGHRFFDAREAWARELGMDRTTFCAVIRPPDHPARPAGYRPLDAFWHKRGYQPTRLTCSFPWRDVGEATESCKCLRFWSRTLNQ